MQGLSPCPPEACFLVLCGVAPRQAQGERASLATCGRGREVAGPRVEPGVTFVGGAGARGEGATAPSPAAPPPLGGEDFGGACFAGCAGKGGWVQGLSPCPPEACFLVFCVAPRQARDERGGWAACGRGRKEAGPRVKPGVTFVGGDGACG